MLSAAASWLVCLMVSIGRFAVKWGPWLPPIAWKSKGTQEHTFTLSEYVARFREHFEMMAVLDALGNIRIQLVLKLLVTNKALQEPS